VNLKEDVAMAGRGAFEAITAQNMERLLNEPSDDEEAWDLVDACFWNLEARANRATEVST
jgi:hypothetical protein